MQKILENWGLQDHLNFEWFLGTATNEVTDVGYVAIKWSQEGLEEAFSKIMKCHPIMNLWHGP